MNTSLNDSVVIPLASVSSFDDFRYESNDYQQEQIQRQIEFYGEPYPDTVDFWKEEREEKYYIIRMAYSIKNTAMNNMPYKYYLYEL